MRIGDFLKSEIFSYVIEFVLITVDNRHIGVFVKGGTNLIQVFIPHFCNKLKFIQIQIFKKIMGNEFGDFVLMFSYIDSKIM